MFRGERDGGSDVRRDCGWDCVWVLVGACKLHQASRTPVTQHNTRPTSTNQPHAPAQQLVLVSAGYDAGYMDPLGQMMCSSDDFRCAGG
jgi:acetoin utilization deacetylase AcuC-like enzyme